MFMHDFVSYTIHTRMHRRTQPASIW